MKVSDLKINVLERRLRLILQILMAKHGWISGAILSS